MITIDYYFSLLSPFTYLAGLGLEEIARRHGAAIRYKPVNIMDLFNETGGTPPAKRHWSRQEYRLQELRRLSKSLAMPLNIKPAHWPVDVTFASQVVIAAEQAGVPVGGLVHGLLRAVWAEDRDISDRDTVLELARDNDVSPGRIEPMLDDAATRYPENTREAIERGVFGSPFYCVGEERFWGQDRLWLLEEHLAERVVTEKAN
jgi:2-hydroxychromene-2-carboxylate isomerase